MKPLVYKFDIEARNSEPGVLFHFTYAPLKILTDGYIRLSIASFNFVEKDVQKNHDLPFFLSTARNLSGSYTRSRLILRRFAAILVLDSSKIRRQRNTRIVPVDFFIDNDPFDKEAEDRVISSKPSLPLEVIKAIVIVINPAFKSWETEIPNILEIVKAAKDKGIPVEVYGRLSDYIRKDSKTISVESLEKMAGREVHDSEDKADVASRPESKYLAKLVNMVSSVVANKNVDSIRDFSPREDLIFAMIILNGDKDLEDAIEGYIMASSKPIDADYPLVAKLVQLLMDNRIRFKGYQHNPLEPVKKLLNEILSKIPGFDIIFDDFKSRI